MNLPDEPNPSQVLRDPSLASKWITMNFAPLGASLPGVVACLKCASIVVDGEQDRHYQSLHGFRGFF